MDKIHNLTKFGLIWDCEDFLWSTKDDWGIKSHLKELLTYTQKRKFKNRTKVKIIASQVSYLKKDHPVRQEIQKIFTVGYLLRTWKKLYDTNSNGVIYSDFPKKTELQQSIN